MGYLSRAPLFEKQSQQKGEIAAVTENVKGREQSCKGCAANKKEKKTKNKKKEGVK